MYRYLHVNIMCTPSCILSIQFGSVSIGNTYFYFCISDWAEASDMNIFMSIWRPFLDPLDPSPRTYCISFIDNILCGFYRLCPIPNSCLDPVRSLNSVFPTSEPIMITSPTPCSPISHVSTVGRCQVIHSYTELKTKSVPQSGMTLAFSSTPLLLYAYLYSFGIQL